MSAIERQFNNTFTLYRRDRATDGQGGWSITYAVNATAEGRIRPASSTERDVAMQEQAQISHVLYVLATTDIARGDQVELDDLVWDVIAVREPSLAAVHYEVDCMTTQTETTVEDGS